MVAALTGTSKQGGRSTVTLHSLSCTVTLPDNAKQAWPPASSPWTQAGLILFPHAFFSWVAFMPCSRVYCAEVRLQRAGWLPGLKLGCTPQWQAKLCR